MNATMLVSGFFCKKHLIRIRVIGPCIFGHLIKYFRDTKSSANGCLQYVKRQAFRVCSAISPTWASTEEIGHTKLIFKKVLPMNILVEAFSLARVLIMKQGLKTISVGLYRIRHYATSKTFSKKALTKHKAEASTICKMCE